MRNKYPFFFLLGLILILSAEMGLAQDQIHTVNGGIIQCKIVKDSPFGITYRVWGDTTARSEFIKRKDVQLINMARVKEPISFQEFDKPDTNVTSRKEYELKNEYGPNLISLIPLQMGVRPGPILIGSGIAPEELYKNHYGLSYERVLKGGKVGLRVLAYGGPNPNFWGGGLEGKWYPKGQGMVRLFMGAALHAAYVETEYQIRPPQGTEEDIKDEAFWISPLFTGGLSIQPNVRFNLTLFGNIGGGFAIDNIDTYSFMNAQAGLSIGYRFW